jgi:hypothetical protein
MGAWAAGATAITLGILGGLTLLAWMVIGRRRDQ